MTLHRVWAGAGTFRVCASGALPPRPTCSLASGSALGNSAATKTADLEPSRELPMLGLHIYLETEITNWPLRLGLAGTLHPTRRPWP